MAVTAPTRTATVSAGFTNTTSPQSAPSVNWSAGDVVVVIAGCGGVATFGTPAVTGLTFVAQRTNGAASSSASGVWVAVASSGGSGTVQMTCSAAANGWGFRVWVTSNTDGVGASFEQHTTTKTVSLTPVRAHSQIIWAAFDFSAGSITGATPTSTNTPDNSSVPGAYSWLTADLTDQSSAGAISYGVTGSTTGVISIIGVEILGSGGGIFRRATGATAAGTTSVTATQPSPDNSQAGDVFLAFILDHATSGSSAAPTGWTRIGGAAGTGGRLQVFRAIDGAGSLTGTSWSFTGLTTRSQAVIVNYGQVDNTTPEDGVTPSARINASGTTGTLSVTSLTNNAMIVAAFGALAANSTWSAEAVVTSPTLAEFFEAANSTFCSIALADAIKATAGATGASSATMGTAGANGAILLSLRPASTNTNALTTASDTLSFSDSNAENTTHQRTATDTASFSESAAKTIAAQRSASDTVSFSDSATPTKGVSKTASDSLSFSDSASRDSKAVNRTASDTASFSETPARVVAHRRSVTDSASQSDSASELTTHARTATDSVSLSESAARVAQHPRAATDSLSTSDSTARLTAASRSTSDTVSLIEAATKALSLRRTVTDSVTLSDSADALVTPAASGNHPQRTASDSLSFSDVISEQTTHARTALDSLALTEAAARSTTALRAIVDSFVSSETASRTTTRGRTLSDSFTFADDVAALVVHGAVKPIHFVGWSALCAAVAVSSAFTDCADSISELSFDASMEEALSVAVLSQYCSMSHEVAA